MVEDLNILLLTGGHDTVDSSWSKSASDIDKCYKLYMPVAGEAAVVLDGKAYPIEAGRIYFFSGFKLEEQYCEDHMEVYWVHCLPEALQLRHFLSGIAPFHSWPAEMNPFGERIYGVIEKLFSRGGVRWRHSEFITSALSCEVNACILHVIADLLERARIEIGPERDMLMRKILPSLYYINENIYKDLKLADIAEKSDLSSTYFHRIFKQLFNTTPVNYMIERRMSAARQMLTTTDLSVREIAWRSGYDNEFYFSRIFKKHVGLSPSDFRRHNSILHN